MLGAQTPFAPRRRPSRRDRGRGLVRDIKTLVAMRLKRGLKSHDVARAINISASYISAIERGRRRGSPEILSAYETYVENVPDAAPSNPVVQEFLSILNDTKPRTLSDANASLLRLHNADKQFGNKQDADLAEFFHILSTNFHTLVDAHSSVAFAWDSLEAYDHDIVRLATDICIYQGARFSMLFLPSSKARAAENEIAWILRQQLLHVYYKSRFSFDSVSDFDFRAFPIDFFLAYPELSSVRFASSKYGVKNGMLISNLTRNRDNSSANLGAIKEYIEKVSQYADKRVTIFRGPGDLNAHLEYFVAAENNTGRRLLAQPFLGSHTRPPEQYGEGTEWRARYDAVNGRFGMGIDMRRLADRRREGNAALRQRMLAFDVKQICSRTRLREWAKTGERPQNDFLFPVEGVNLKESAPYRVAKIDYIQSLLTNNPRFKLGLVDDDEVDLGWSGDRSIKWLVQGNDQVLFEFTIENDIASTDFDEPVRDAHREREFNSIRGADEPLWIQVGIRSEPVAKAFARYFDSVWTRITDTDNQSVAAEFEELKALVPR